MTFVYDPLKGVQVVPDDNSDFVAFVDRRGSSNDVTVMLDLKACYYELKKLREFMDNIRTQAFPVISVENELKLSLTRLKL